MPIGRGWAGAASTAWWDLGDVFVGERLDLAGERRVITDCR